jgi:hypothetical protein
MQPSPSRLTFNPVFPTRVYSIVVFPFGMLQSKFDA